MEVDHSSHGPATSRDGSGYLEHKAGRMALIQIAEGGKRAQLHGAHVRNGLAFMDNTMPIPFHLHADYKAAKRGSPCAETTQQLYRVCRLINADTSRYLQMIGKLQDEGIMILSQRVSTNLCNSVETDGY